MKNVTLALTIDAPHALHKSTVSKRKGDSR